jgi:hypothetical protein
MSLPEPSETHKKSAVRRRCLLHVCCAPDAAVPFRDMKAEGWDILGYFYGSNIHPEDEYRRRAGALEFLARAEGVEVLSRPYEPEEWFARASGLADEPAADREIKLLSRELEQQKLVKKYLMRQLLTGKTRVKTVSAEYVRSSPFPGGEGRDDGDTHVGNVQRDVRRKDRRLPPFRVRLDERVHQLLASQAGVHLQRDDVPRVALNRAVTLHA